LATDGLLKPWHVNQHRRSLVRRAYTGVDRERHTALAQSTRNGRARAISEYNVEERDVGCVPFEVPEGLRHTSERSRDAKARIRKGRFECHADEGLILPNEAAREGRLSGHQPF